jgi:hypothetical protein
MVLACHAAWASRRLRHGGKSNTSIVAKEKRSTKNTNTCRTQQRTAGQSKHNAGISL